MNKIKWDVLAVWVGALAFCLAAWYFLIKTFVDLSQGDLF